MSKPTLWATAKTSQKISSRESAGVNGRPHRIGEGDQAEVPELERQRRLNVCVVLRVARLVEQRQDDPDRQAQFAGSDRNPGDA